MNKNTRETKRTAFSPSFVEKGVYALLMALIFWRTSIQTSFVLRSSLPFETISWHLFHCVCFIVHDISTFSIVLHIWVVLVFESFRPHSIFLPWFAYLCIFSTIPRQHHVIYSALLASGCWLESSRFYRLDGRLCQPRLQSPKEVTFGTAFRKASNHSSKLLLSKGLSGRLWNIKTSCSDRAFLQIVAWWFSVLRIQISSAAVLLVPGYIPGPHRKPTR